MANLDIGSRTPDIAQVRIAVQRSAHVQRARQMLVAAGIAALSLVLIAGALLTQAF
ncbi:hypothetical protein [Devosia soli]|uniref:hypothetical protein n=1 Tax=Devosia soli TaxID=361041 RepID=UPI000AE0205B|nr:hypothetical protein [Devosia soli]